MGDGGWGMGDGGWGMGMRDWLKQRGRVGCLIVDTVVNWIERGDCRGGGLGRKKCLRWK